LRTEEEESASKGRSAGKSRKVKKKSHNHIGPNVRAFRVGRAFCPTCDGDRLLRLTEWERLQEQNAKDALKTYRKR
jgi:hypothetical protein